MFIYSISVKNKYKYENMCILPMLFYDGRTGTMCDNNDHLFGIALVGQYRIVWNKDGLQCFIHVLWSSFCRRFFAIRASFGKKPTTLNNHV